MSESNDSRDYAQWEKETTSEIRSRILGVREKIIEVLCDMQDARCALDLSRTLDALEGMRTHLAEANAEISTITVAALFTVANRVSKH